MSARKTNRRLVEVAKKFEDCGFGILATGTTYELLKENGIKAERINKMQEGKPNIVDAIINGKIQLIINTPATGDEKAFDDSYVRKTAIQCKGSIYDDDGSSKSYGRWNLYRDP